jgi:hypothetical protein
MENPWLQYDVTDANTVHRLDRQKFDEVNSRIRKKKNSDDYLLSSSNVALPYFGNPEGNFVILYANPGLDKELTSLEETPERAHLFDLARRHSLENPHPFVFLTPEFEGTPGFKWWEKTLGPILKRFDGIRLEVLSNIFSVELHPYKSVKYEVLTKSEGSFPSSLYSNDLVSMAISRGALVLIARAKEQWFDAVPELRTYSRVIYLSSSQNSVISPNNVRYLANSNLHKVEDQKNLAWQLITKVALRHPPSGAGLPEELDELLGSFGK